MDMYRLYREIDQKAAEFYYRLNGQKEFERTPFIPNIQNKQTENEYLGQLMETVEQLPAPEPQFEVVKGHLKDFVQALSWKLEALYTEPQESLDVFLWKYEDIKGDARSEEEKDEVLLTLYGQTEAVLNGIRSWYRECEPSKLVSCRNAIENACQDIRRNTFENAAVAEVMDKAAGAMEEFCAELSALPSGEEMEKQADAGDERTIPLPVEEYRALLHDHRGVELDELLDWGASEMEKTRSECFAIAAKLAEWKGEPAPADMAGVNDLLLRYAGPCDSAEEMFERGAAYLKRTRALAHEYVKLPEDECCELRKTPWQLRTSFPWGGYSDGDPKRRPVTGYMFLNQFNYQAVTDGWIKMNCLHEAYPGHHVQFVRRTLDPIPETMKIGAKNIPLIEGTAHRTERAFQDIYAEDPFFPLFVAYRRHHTAVRIQADLMLRYYGRPIREAVELYMRELGFDYRTARGQVEAQETMPGYFTCYYYGMKKICDMEEKYGIDKKTYTELLFSLGSVSLQTFEKMLQLTDEQREHLFHDFESLYM